MEYSWGLIITAVGLMCGSVFLFYSRALLVNQVLHHATNAVENVQQEITEDISSVAQGFQQASEKVGSYVKDAGILLTLAFLTVGAKLFELDVVWAPFWASVGFYFYLLTHFVRLKQMLVATHNITTELGERLIQQYQLTKLVPKGINSSSIEQPDWSLTKDKDYDIKS